MMKTVSFLRKPVSFEGRYTTIPNAWVRDNRLGYRAKGILVLLMSHQSGWRISLEHLANDGPDGITAIRTAIIQLQDAGYLRRNLIRDAKNRVEASEWIISDPFEEIISDDDFRLENLTSENLTSENLTLKKPILKETNIEEDISHKPKQVELFEQFWKLYPRKIGKGSARTAFDKALKKASFDEIMGGCQAYANSANLPEMQFIPHPTTWLNQERWTDDLQGIASRKDATTTAMDIMRRAQELGRKEVE